LRDYQDMVSIALCSFTCSQPRARSEYAAAFHPRRIVHVGTSPWDGFAKHGAFQDKQVEHFFRKHAHFQFQLNLQTPGAWKFIVTLVLAFSRQNTTILREMPGLSMFSN